MAGRSENPARVRSILRDAIQNGVYPPGSTLPSTRELAARFQINRNTASKIYQELAHEQVIKLGAHRPPTVVNGLPSYTRDAFLQRLRDALEPLLVDGRLVGLAPEETRRILIETADELLAHSLPPSIYVVECNREEASTYAQELTMKLGTIVQPVLLDQLGTDLPADVIISPYFHMQEVREALGEEDQRLVGLVVTADSTDIARVATMVSSGPLGVVAINLHAAERLRRLLGFQVNVPMVIAATDQPETLEAIQSEVEYVACTVRAYAETQALVPGLPVTLVRYHADEQSIQHIRQEIHRVGNLRRRTPHSDIPRTG